jgi:hypothetical protein
MHSIDIELEQIVCCKSQGTRVFAIDMEKASSPALVLKSCPTVDALEKGQVDIRKCYRQANLSG